MLQGLPMALRHVKAGNSHLNTVNCNKYQSKATMQTRNQYLDCLIDPSF